MAKSKRKCGMCFGTKEVAYIAVPKGKRVRRCPECAGGKIPSLVQKLTKAAAGKKIA